jgi:hypothetical protein
LNCAAEAVEGNDLALERLDIRWILSQSSKFKASHRLSLAQAGLVTKRINNTGRWPFMHEMIQHYAASSIKLSNLRSSASSCTSRRLLKL